MLPKEIENNFVALMEALNGLKLEFKTFKESTEKTIAAFITFNNTGWMYSCKVCGEHHIQPEDWNGDLATIEHGKGCFRVSEEGGGSEAVERSECYRNECG